jgi:hypothetical protein
MLDFIPDWLTLPDTPIWRFLAIIGCAWILLAIFYPVVIGLLVFAVIVGIGGLVTGGVATIVRALLG